MDNEQKANLCNQIKSLYPDISQHGIQIAAVYLEEQRAWTVNLKKGKLCFTSLLEEEDLDRILSGQKCLSLAIEIQQIVDSANILS
jgi:hypothetical protein